MKYLKTFEYIVYLRDLNIGDYVLIDLNDYYSLLSPQYQFINNTIGKIVGIESVSIKVEYENIPYDIKRFFRDGKFITFTSSKIKYHAKTKDDVEAMIDSEKYNL